MPSVIEHACLDATGRCVTLSVPVAVGGGGGGGVPFCLVQEAHGECLTFAHGLDPPIRCTTLTVPSKYRHLLQSAQSLRQKLVHMLWETGRESVAAVGVAVTASDTTFSTATSGTTISTGNTRTPTTANPHLWALSMCERVFPVGSSVSSSPQLFWSHDSGEIASSWVRSFLLGADPLIPAAVSAPRVREWCGMPAMVTGLASPPTPFPASDVSTRPTTLLPVIYCTPSFIAISVDPGCKDCCGYAWRPLPPLTSGGGEVATEPEVPVFPFVHSATTGGLQWMRLGGEDQSLDARVISVRSLLTLTGILDVYREELVNGQKQQQQQHLGVKQPAGLRPLPGLGHALSTGVDDALGEGPHSMGVEAIGLSVAGGALGAALRAAKHLVSLAPAAAMQVFEGGGKGRGGVLPSHLSLDTTALTTDTGLEGEGGEGMNVYGATLDDLSTITSGSIHHPLHRST